MILFQMSDIKGWKAVGREIAALHYATPLKGEDFSDIKTMVFETTDQAGVRKRVLCHDVMTLQT